MKNLHVVSLLSGQYLSSFLLLALALTVGGAASAREAARPESQPTDTQICQSLKGGCGECTTGFGFKGTFIGGECRAC